MGIANRKNVQGPDRPAVLWDMDGVVVDTAPYHFEAWQQTFVKLGVKYTLAKFKESFGKRNEAIIPEIMGKPVSPEEVARYRPRERSPLPPPGTRQNKAFPGSGGAAAAPVEK